MSSEFHGSKFCKPAATTTRGSRIVQEEAVNDFEGQYLVKFGCVISIPLNMTPYNRLEPFSCDVGPGKTTRIEQHFLNVSG